MEPPFDGTHDSRDWIAGQDGLVLCEQDDQGELGIGSTPGIGGLCNMNPPHDLNGDPQTGVANGFGPDPTGTEITEFAGANSSNEPDYDAVYQIDMCGNNFTTGMCEFDIPWTAQVAAAQCDIEAGESFLYRAIYAHWFDNGHVAGFVDPLDPNGLADGSYEANDNTTAANQDRLVNDSCDSPWPVALLSDDAEVEGDEEGTIPNTPPPTDLPANQTCGGEAHIAVAQVALAQAPTAKDGVKLTLYCGPVGDAAQSAIVDDCTLKGPKAITDSGDTCNAEGAAIPAGQPMWCRYEPFGSDVIYYVAGCGMKLF